MALTQREEFQLRRMLKAFPPAEECRDYVIAAKAHDLNSSLRLMDRTKLAIIREFRLAGIQVTPEAVRIRFKELIAEVLQDPRNHDLFV